MRLLVVEDDDRLSGLLRRGLRAQGFAVDDAATVEDAHWMASVAGEVVREASA